MLQLWNIYCSYVTLLFTHFNDKFVKKRTFNFKRKSSMILLSVNRGIIYWITWNNNRLDVHSWRIHNRFALLLFPTLTFRSFLFLFFQLSLCLFETTAIGGKSKLDHAIIHRKILHVAKRRIFTDHSWYVGIRWYQIIASGRIDISLNWRYS